MEGDRDTIAPSPAPATMSPGNPRKFHRPSPRLRTQVPGGGLLERPGRPRDSGEVRSPDPRAPIRPPPVIEASSEVEPDESDIERSGRASSGAGPGTRRLPGNREAGARPRRDTPAEVMMGRNTTTTHDLAALAEAAVAVATHDPSAITTSEPAGPSLAPIISTTIAATSTLPTSHP